MRMPYRMVWAIVLLALAGFLDATYLTAEHYLQGPIPCAIVEGCETVINSEYSVLLGVPISLFGVIYYLTIAALALIFLSAQNSKFFHALFALSGLGFLVSLFLLYLQAFALEAYCLYCLISITVSTLIFLASLTIFIKMKK